MLYSITEISPGCQLIYKQINSPVAHFAVFTECGTRHEKHFPEGIAHFLEHMIFKGTTKRKTYHILSGLENTGCDVNAFTSKEELVLHASFLEEYGSRITGLLAEIMFESSFPEAEIEKERNVIMDEIAMLKDSPADMLLEDYEKLLFGKHPLSREILGNKKSLKQVDRNTMLDFYNNVFLKSRKVILYYGKKSQEKVARMIKASFGSYLSCISGDPLTTELLEADPSVFNTVNKVSTHQTHVAMGAPAYDVRNPKKNALGLLINILGGQAFNSRLNLVVREKYGLSYSIDAFYNVFADSGYWSVYFSAENGSPEKTLSIIHKELKKLREQKIGTLQLHIAKKQLIGQTAIFLDSAASDLISAGKVFLYSGKVPAFEEIRTQIEQVDASQMLEIANEVMTPEKISTLTYLPKGK
jgi:predicted Zn-dependent peptidase